MVALLLGHAGAGGEIEESEDLLRTWFEEYILAAAATRAEIGADYENCGVQFIKRIHHVLELLDVVRHLGDAQIALGDLCVGDHVHLRSPVIGEHVCSFMIT